MSPDPRARKRTGHIAVQGAWNNSSVPLNQTIAFSFRPTALSLQTRCAADIRPSSEAGGSRLLRVVVAVRVRSATVAAVDEARGREPVGLRSKKYKEVRGSMSSRPKEIPCSTFLATAISSLSHEARGTSSAPCSTPPLPLPVNEPSSGLCQRMSSNGRAVLD